MRTVSAAIALTILLASSALAGRFAFNAPATTNNDDSCDLGSYPAATLLLPYFEVGVSDSSATARTTLFTVTNVSDLPQIARVTLWSDLAYPVLTFNIFLTGYDVQPINLYDVLVRGIIAPPTGTSSDGGPGSPIGVLSASNSANPNQFPATPTISCTHLPGAIPTPLLNDVRAALTSGMISSCATARIGTPHPNAIGYATIDVVANCDSLGPLSPGYWDELLYDNVLIGDYQQVDPKPTTGNYASGNQLVRIRAVPEGGIAKGVTGTNLPYTFYDRLTPRNGDRTRDRRQPLPSTFAARYIQGGTGSFNTNFKIWREATVGPDATCADYNAKGSPKLVDVVRFDEHENPTSFYNFCLACPPFVPTMPEASSIPTSSMDFPPQSSSGDVGGWMYLNLNNGGSTDYSAGLGRNFTTGTSTTTGPRQSQNWVVVSMFAEGRYAVEFDASSLGNGCSPSPSLSNAQGGASVMGPLPNQTP